MSSLFIRHEYQSAAKIDNKYERVLKTVWMAAEKDEKKKKFYILARLFTPIGIYTYLGYSSAYIEGDINRLFIFKFSFFFFFSQNDSDFQKVIFMWTESFFFCLFVRLYIYIRGNNWCVAYIRGVGGKLKTFRIFFFLPHLFV